MRLGGFLIAWWGVAVTLIPGLPWWAGLVFALAGLSLDMGSHCLRRKMSSLIEVSHERLLGVDGRLREAIDILGGENSWGGVSIKKIGSKLPTAFCLSKRERGEVFVTTGLEESLTDRQMAAALLHEIAHIRMRHEDKAFRSACSWAMLGMAACVPAMLMMPFVGDGEARGAVSLANMLVAGAMMIFSLRRACELSREQEFEADAFVRERGLGMELASALDVLSEGGGGKDGGKWFSSHPSTVERVERLGCHRFGGV